jgi:hypothetical protein
MDVKVDNQVTINSWHGRGPKSLALSKVARSLFEEVTERNLMLEMTYIPSGSNPADQPSRRLTRADAMLSATSWGFVQSIFGGPNGHNLDLMALDSNVQHNTKGEALRHFTPLPTPCSSGVNVFNQDLSVCDGLVTNAYVFPPFALIAPLLKFIQSQGATVTLVAPKLSPLPIWWPLLNSMSERKALITKEGSSNAILFPTKQGFQPGTLKFELWAFRVSPGTY